MRVYGVELSFNNKDEVLILPVNPQSIDVSESGQGKTYDVVGIGEVNVIKNRKLTDYSLSSIFPAQKYPFVVGDELLYPVEYIKMIEKWMTTKRPIRFIFKSNTFDINTAASIESFDWKEVAGSGGDIEYTLQLKKYVFYEAKRIVQATGSGKVVQKKQKAARPNETQQPKTYTMVAGDSLWKVAQMKLGDGTRYKEIQKLNNIKDSDFKRLPIGKVLKLP